MLPVCSSLSSILCKNMSNQHACQPCWHSTGTLSLHQLLPVSTHVALLTYAAISKCVQISTAIQRHNMFRLICPDWPSWHKATAEIFCIIPDILKRRTASTHSILLSVKYVCIICNVGCEIFYSLGFFFFFFNSTWQC